MLKKIVSVTIIGILFGLYYVYSFPSKDAINNSEIPLDSSDLETAQLPQF